MECKRCLLTSDIATLNNTQCEYCDLHDNLEKQYRNVDFDIILKKIKNQKGKYNCITGISGGIDSSTLLYASVKKWGLKPLVIHFDNNWNTTVAKHNMNNLIKKLDVDCITYHVNRKEYDNLNKAFLKAGVPDADIPNDVAMTKLMYDTADKYNIKYILNGHCFRTEGSTPKEWTYMDARYIQSVYHKYYKDKLKNFPLFTFSNQIEYANKGIEQIRPYYYLNVNRKELDKEMIVYIKWKKYGWKHGENIYTDFVGHYLLPRKFGIDKRIVYLSALVRTGEMKKEDARDEMNIESNFDTSMVGDEYISLIDSPVVSRNTFDKYNFKKYKWLIYYLYVIGTVPYTFYAKYTDKVSYNYSRYADIPTDKKKELINIIKNEDYSEDPEINDIKNFMLERIEH
jgi:tRNA(Ile)-lysidine synthase TilS/MesJ